MISGFIGAIGGTISILIPMIFLTEEGVHPAFRPIMIGIAIFSMVCLIWSSYYLTENKYTQQEESFSFFRTS